MKIIPVPLEYFADPLRYEKINYRRAGLSGIQLPVVSLGLWNNFSGVDSIENSRAMLRTAFDLGITHFDLANNYGPPPGSAEETFGAILKKDFLPYRDELIISSKAGYDMWPGPYGDFGSRKYLIASIDQSLKRMGLDYVDIFYHHRPDPNTPLEETMGALDAIVRSGKALYAGISNYHPKEAHQAIKILRQLGTPCLIHQPNYSMLDRWVEEGLLDELSKEGVGCIVFSPLAQGILTNRYLNGIPEDSRAAKPNSALDRAELSDMVISKVRRLNEFAQQLGLSLAQLAINWVLRRPEVTSALIGASRPSQITEIVQGTWKTALSKEDMQTIEVILSEE
ncbi:MAG: L-glyceraldehyde 3-phosphate reductase [Chloroflexi bacterium 44-23]|nr:MAG: L-glyceraldehyde 3-phosphate reductase [Chloroflexi bacterium 44-23]